MPKAIVIEGHAIVSADGMIADRDGGMPAALRNDADWQRFQQALDRAALVVLGRLGHERHPNPGRQRLVFTHSVAGLQPAGLAQYWNPEAGTLAETLAAIGVVAGTVAVTGGTGVFDYFLPHYDGFALAEVHGFVVPDGRPCFSQGHPRAVLARHGLRPAAFEMIDSGVSLTHWRR
ncbi:MAG TPA: dihydrofolate reductase [Devosiaceae bacterium]|jgi:hypothetical protein